MTVAKTSRKKVYDCTLCGLDKNKYLNTSNLDAEILVVRDFPATTEVQYKNYFATIEGRYLKQSLEKAEIDLSKCYFTYALLCNLPKPPRANLPIDQIKSCGSNIINLIQTLPNLKLILTFGDYGFKFFSNKSQLKKHRGEMFKKDKLNIFSVFDPKYVLTNKQEEKTFINDLIKARKIVNGEIKAGQDIKFLLCKTTDDLNYAKQKLNESEYYAFDIETIGGEHGLDAFSPNNKIMTIGFTTDKLESFCIPIDHPERYTHKAAVTDFTREVLFNNSKRIAHNGRFDVRCVSKLLDIPVANVYFDTMLASSILNQGNGNSNSLKRLAIEHLGYAENYSVLEEGVENDKIPLGDLARYNCEDTHNTILLYRILNERLKEEELSDLFYDIVMPGNEVLTDIELNGSKIDTAYGNKLLVKYEENKKTLRYKLQHHVSFHSIIAYGRTLHSERKSEIDSITYENKEDSDLYKSISLCYEMDNKTNEVNINSNDSLAAYIYDTLGLKCPKLTETGKRSTDVESLNKLSDHPFVADLLLYKKYEKAIGTYITPLMQDHLKHDGKIHCNYNQAVTTTGRLCLRKGTFIDVVRDISKYPKGIPIEDVQIGDNVYCYDDNKKLAIKKVIWSGKTGHKKLIRLHWIGQGNHHKGYVDVTPEHQIRLIDGSYKRAIDLSINDRVLALHREVKKKYGYAHLYSTGNKIPIREHRFIRNYLFNDVDGTVHVHHINGNKVDNRPENLQAMAIKEHLKYEASVNKEERLKKISATLKRKYANGEIIINARKGEDCWNWKGLSKGWIIEVLKENKGKPTIFRDKYGIDYETIQKYMKLHNIDFKSISKWYNKKGEFLSREFVEKAATIRPQEEAQKFIGLGFYRFKEIQKEYELIPWNHRITKIEDINEVDDVYDLEVEDHHNFIANELCVHNSSSYPNLQNIPSRGEMGKDIKKLFVPSEADWVLLQADYSQIELRMAAILANEPIMLDAYANNKDIHMITAATVLNKKIEDVTKEDRQKAKSVAFGFLYGGSAQGFVTYAKKSYGVDFTLEQAEQVRSKFFKLYSALPKWYEKIWKDCRRHNYVKSLFGRKRIIDNINSKNSYLRGAAERQSINHPDQGSCADMLLLALYHINKYIKEKAIRAKIINTVHDSIVLECHKDDLMRTAKIVKTIMENIPTPFEKLCPIKAELEYGPNWGDLEPLKF